MGLRSGDHPPFLPIVARAAANTWYPGFLFLSRPPRRQYPILDNESALRRIRQALFRRGENAMRSAKAARRSLARHALSIGATVGFVETADYRVDREGEPVVLGDTK